MYLIGKIITGTEFKSIHAVFKTMADVEDYNQKHKNELEMIRVHLEYPFFILQEFHSTIRHYKSITKEELKDKILNTKKLTDNQTIYFNLWRIDSNLYNEDFPDEPVLRGKDFHIHFMNTDFEKIEEKGFEHYWEEIHTD